MTDTPQHIQDLQLELWLQKSPGERLLQGLKNNEAVFLLFKSARQEMLKMRGQQPSTTDCLSESSPSPKTFC
jgi:hypothetical protein